MNETDHERWREDVAAYLLGVLDPERAAGLERHAEDCERCRRELRWLTPAVDALPESVERIEPPPDVRARLMAEVEADAAEHASAPQPRPRRRRWLLRPAVGFAALALIVAAVIGYSIGSSDGEDASTISAGKPPDVTAKMISEGDSGTLRLANVHNLPEDKVLEAWVQRNGKVEPVRALFVPDRRGRASTTLPDMSGVEAVMVTAEPRGGSDEPTSPPIVTLSIPG